MTKAEKRIIQSLKQGNFLLTLHARKRMDERVISELDIIEVARTLSSITFQPKQDTYLLKGEDTWGQALAVIAALRGTVLIVTVFLKGEK